MPRSIIFGTILIMSYNIFIETLIYFIPTKEFIFEKTFFYTFLILSFQILAYYKFKNRNFFDKCVLILFLTFFIFYLIPFLKYKENFIKILVEEKLLNKINYDLIDLLILKNCFPIKKIHLKFLYTNLLQILNLIISSCFTSFFDLPNSNFINPEKTLNFFKNQINSTIFSIIPIYNFDSYFLVHFFNVNFNRFFTFLIISYLLLIYIFFNIIFSYCPRIILFISPFLFSITIFIDLVINFFKFCNLDEKFVVILVFFIFYKYENLALSIIIPYFLYYSFIYILYENNIFCEKGKYSICFRLLKKCVKYFFNLFKNFFKKCVNYLFDLFKKKREERENISYSFLKEYVNFVEFNYSINFLNLERFEKDFNSINTSNLIFIDFTGTKTDLNGKQEMINNFYKISPNPFVFLINPPKCLKDEFDNSFIFVFDERSLKFLIDKCVYGNLPIHFICKSLRYEYFRTLFRRRSLRRRF